KRDSAKASFTHVRFDMSCRSHALLTRLWRREREIVSNLLILRDHGDLVELGARLERLADLDLEARGVHEMRAAERSDNCAADRDRTWSCCIRCGRANRSARRSGPPWRPTRVIAMERIFARSRCLRISSSGSPSREPMKARFYEGELWKKERCTSSYRCWKSTKRPRRLY